MIDKPRRPKQYDPYRILVKEGQHVVQFVHHEVGQYFGGKRDYLHFTLVDRPDLHEIDEQSVLNTILRVYNGLLPGVLLRKSHNLRKDFLRLIDNNRPPRMCFHPVDLVEGCQIEAWLRTVTKDDEGKELPPDEHHSRIDRFSKIVGGTPPAKGAHYRPRAPQRKR